MSRPVAPCHGPQPAYTELHINQQLYTRLAATAGSSSRSLFDALTVPPRSGRAWHVPAGSIVRLSTPEGPQVGDLNIWAWGKDEKSQGRDGLARAQEHFWAARTRQLNGAHVRIFDRLWSNLPYLRPLCTMIANSLEGHEDEYGGRCHDLLGTRCDPYVSTLLAGAAGDYTCHSNLTRAIAPFNLPESAVHDVLNVFQVTGLDDQGRYFMRPSPATASSYVEFFAETDLLCALSTCPGGDLSAWAWDGAGNNAAAAVADGEAGDLSIDERMRRTCRLIKVEVWKLTEEAKRILLVDWEESKPVDYRGLHGIQVPTGEEQ